MRITLVGLFVGFALTAGDAGAEDRLLLIARVGAYEPRLSRSGDVLAERSGSFGLERRDWLGVHAGMELAFKATSFLELGQHFDGLVSEVDLPRGGPDRVDHLRADAVVIGLSVRLIPTRTGARFAPYLAAGPDLLLWRYKESGPASTRKADGTSAGFHAAAGLRVAVTRELWLSAEYRRLFGELDLHGAFAGQQLDLTGDVATLGLAYRF